MIFATFTALSLCSCGNTSTQDNTQKTSQSQTQQENNQSEQNEEERIAAEKAEQERLAEEQKAEEEKAAAEKAEAERIAQEQAAAQEQQVYVTPYGEKYHLSAECAGDNARQVGISQVESLEPCKKCAGG